MISKDIQKLARNVTGGGSGIDGYVPISRATSAEKAHRLLVDDDPNRGSYSGGWSTVSYYGRTHREPMTLDAARDFSEQRMDRMDKGDAEGIKIIESSVVDERSEVVKVKAGNAGDARMLGVAKVKKSLRARKNVVDTLHAAHRATKLRDGGRTPMVAADWGKSGWIVLHTTHGFRSNTISGQFLAGGAVLSKAKAKQAIQEHYETDHYAGKTQYLMVDVYPGAVLTPSGTASALPTWEVTVYIKRVKTGTKPIGWYIFGIAST